MKRSTIVTIAFLVAIGGVLLYTTLRSQQAECTVCVAFNGENRCATASANSEAEAATAAQVAACGPLTSGMNDAIACQSRPPVSRSCSAR
ncbi:MAG TPA: hypothetical protein VKZ41_10075 [Gemmatimonadales bacterium]|nr:hypothetical protein [Gemmatimonadales bacterium]